MNYLKFLRVFKEEIWSFLQWVLLFLPGRVGHFTRGSVLGLFFGSKGSRITIKENVEIYRPHNFYIGSNSGVGRNNIIDCSGTVRIGQGTRLGPNVTIATMNHASKEEIIGKARKILLPVTIGDNCWIGAGVIILPGVCIGNNCIVAAGAVVTKDIPNNSCVGGIPAKLL
ncbi:MULTISPECIES: DapH/DapD/GlmU-related protein [unclassified Marinobacterium]|uniref:acyltransferase n=1 Tax=unclassified Marinobacterium TaxID=2644139 RepID=UPI00156978E3|nr:MULTISPECIES: DapH/DapD/GlmU-related protein [unclassified Marinobacterium]NRP09211.1 Galactoside O-acetyltransferase [Marinobacterium sp. xm-g-48]NRP82258.1 Galactoside O-acetyltransferase [Marinobacterium sp. xm-d-509]